MSLESPVTGGHFSKERLEPFYLLARGDVGVEEELCTGTRGPKDPHKQNGRRKNLQTPPPVMGSDPTTEVV